MVRADNVISNSKTVYQSVIFGVRFERQKVDKKQTYIHGN